MQCSYVVPPILKVYGAPNEIRTRASRLKILRVNRFTMGAFGAGNGTRTRMPIKARDFKSLMSTYFIIPACGESYGA